jgi:hypothetical protein
MSDPVFLITGRVERGAATAAAAVEAGYHVVLSAEAPSS